MSKPPKTGLIPYLALCHPEPFCRMLQIPRQASSAVCNDVQYDLSILLCKGGFKHIFMGALALIFLIESRCGAFPFHRLGLITVLFLYAGLDKMDVCRDLAVIYQFRPVRLIALCFSDDRFPDGFRDIFGCCVCWSRRQCVSFLYASAIMTSLISKPRFSIAFAASNAVLPPAEYPKSI